jgi:hypothetical protein
MSPESSQDDDLQQLFQRARAHDALNAPSFARVLARSAEPTRRRQLWPALAFGVAVAALVIWRLTPVGPREPVFALVPGDMRVPTDFLLDIASFPRAGEIPRIGVTDWYPLPPSADNRRQQ